MQPTLMGSNEADVYDRILVDKLVQTFREPKRWDITVFKYPLQKNQNYVKRIVGMGGDRLHIAGGNVYSVEGDGDARQYTTLRKPDDLQELMWKNVYPARRLARSETKALGEIFGASPSRAATETASGFSLDPRGSTVRLFFRDEIDGGMIDRVWDGYPAAVAREIREKVAHHRPQEIVCDVRLAADVTLTGSIEQLSMQIEVSRPSRDKVTFAFVVSDGKGRLEVRGKGNRPAWRVRAVRRGDGSRVDHEPDVRSRRRSVDRLARRLRTAALGFIAVEHPRRLRPAVRWQDPATRTAEQPKGHSAIRGKGRRQGSVRRRAD